MFRARIPAAVACAVALGGCTADKMLSDDRIATNTAGILGVSPSQVTISDRRTEFPNTYYTARTSTGQTYVCAINGGNALTFGMVTPPSCTAQATAGRPGRTYGWRGLGG